MIFSNRKQAGRLLSGKLLNYRRTPCVVLALPRGGVPVAAEVAAALEAPLDVLLVRKIGAPFQTELAIGAICEDQEPVWNHSILSQIGYEPEDLQPAVAREKSKILQQRDLFRNGQALPDVHGKVVIVVDDGLATGATMAAAVKYMKTKGAEKIVVAVPIAATSTIRKLQAEVGEIIAQESIEDLMSVGQWYSDFTQVSNNEVLALLKDFRQGAVSERRTRDLHIPLETVTLEGIITTVPAMKALIVFAHGSGSSRLSPRNQKVAEELNEAGFGTLLFDLLTEPEFKDRNNVFNIELLSQRLIAVTRWLRQQPGFKEVQIGFFGASTGSAACIHATSRLNAEDGVYALVSRGGRPDLAGESLEFVETPVLLLVGGQDYEVLELNRHAQKRLRNSKLLVVAGATHLFEEPGTLEEVSQQAVQWFELHLKTKQPEKKPQKPLSLETATGQAMIKLRSEKDLNPLLNAIKDSRVVMLGEASHGTHEFYEMRSLISKRLIKDYGFNFIAVEGDWPDAYRLNRYIQAGEGKNAREVLMHNHRWPTWMWANEEIVKLAEWMRNHRAGFFGLDVYSLFESIDEVVNYVKKNNPDLAQIIQQRYACFTPFEGDEISYARSLLDDPAGCESEVILNLQSLLETRLQDAQKDGDELFSTQQNARIVANAESYYRSMLLGDADSWNVRDGHMMETLDQLLERAGEGAKAIVWAHNTHIGDYRATDMRASGHVNLGGLARQNYGEENVALVGFGTYQGEVLAGSAWGRPEQVMPLPAAKPGSYEDIFHTAAVKAKASQFYLLLRDQIHSPFAQTLGHRAVGVVYDPRQERRGNYVPTELSKRYDAFVFIDRTRALKSLHSLFVRGEFPETWPSGQ
jgi:erythromycin esterase-like protein/predicted phosphoribosyltransferase/predicted alpha/beta-hydrolase family hydrolase